jgi:copper chaperone CopZ
MASSTTDSFFKIMEMKKILSFSIMLLLACSVQAQVQQAKLQASGLTCSMCSKAVLSALQKVPFVKAVDVNIDKQEYNLSFKEGQQVDLDGLSRAVEDAGFSVAKLVVTANVTPTKVEKDQHIKIGGQTFHFLNAKGQQLPQTARFAIVDKGFVSAKEFKKYSSLSAMACVQSGKMQSCCKEAAPVASGRIFHAIL